MSRRHRQRSAGGFLTDHFEAGLTNLDAATTQTVCANGSPAQVRQAIIPAPFMEWPPQRMGVENPAMPASLTGQLDSIAPQRRVEYVAKRIDLGSHDALSSALPGFRAQAAQQLAQIIL